MRFLACIRRPAIALLCSEAYSSRCHPEPGPDMSGTGARVLRLGCSCGMRNLLSNREVSRNRWSSQNNKILNAVMR
jgi:hypothetical protein